MTYRRRLTALAVALALIFGLTANVSAADETEEIQAYLNYDITVSYNGEVQVLRDAGGNTVYPVSYNGTTYVPVRAISNMLGIAVDWDQSTQTVLLSDSTDGAAAVQGLDGGDSKSGSEEIKASINRGITVRYNGEVQELRDAGGNAVYPLSYNGTTYLPIRAVSGLLGLEVDWDQSTQTVLLSSPEISTDSDTEINTDSSTNKNDNDTVTIFDLSTGEQTTVDRDSLDWLNDVFNGLKTSEDAEVLGENHIGYDWVEIDWSTAADSYVRVIVHELPGTLLQAQCRVMYDDNGRCVYGPYYYMTEGEWNIPLYAGDTEYGVQVSLSALACEHYMTDEENEAFYNWTSPLCARFTAEITNPENVWLLSTPYIDYENAPEACAKAAELTKNCKTDAEKITAIYNWVSKNIQYDYDLYNAMEAAEKAAEEAALNNESSSDIPCWVDEENGQHILPPDMENRRYTNQNCLDLEEIMSRRTGVCVHFSILMTGMLRSVGVPCKMVIGYMEKSTGEWESHGWVAVNPGTGTLNKSALGAGSDYSDSDIGKLSEKTGWIRLDPTNASNTDYTSNDKNYNAQHHY